MNYLIRYNISYDDSFIILQSIFLSIILLKAFSVILFYIPNDMNCITFHL